MVLRTWKTQICESQDLASAEQHNLCIKTLIVRPFCYLSDLSLLRLSLNTLDFVIRIILQGRAFSLYVHIS